jgi:GNAT superfamily N-acetyltransferase
LRKITPGWETDLAILKHSGSVIEVFNDYTLIRSPHNPDYHWGNFILVTNKDLVGDAERWMQAFHDAFPEANWVSIGLTEYPTNSDSWDSYGVELERMDVLKSQTMPNIPEISSAYESRMFQDNDWDLLIAREIADNAISGEHEAESFERYITNSINGFRELSRRGLAAWFGAFYESELVADLGIVVCGEIARYQSVQTIQAHRKQGLASHLLGKAGTWAALQGCKNFVIVTESTNDAGRVYRKAGFQIDLETVTVYKNTK